MRGDLRIHFVIAGGCRDSVSRGASGKKGDDGVRLAPFRPIGIHACLQGHHHRSSSLSVLCIHIGTTLDEEARCIVARAPGSDVQRRALGSDPPVAITFPEAGVHGNAQVDQVTDSTRVVVVGEFGEDLSTVCVPVHIDNVNPPSLPRPNRLGIDVDAEYARMLEQMCAAYRARWHT